LDLYQIGVTTMARTRLIDPWVKAEECERAIKACKDPRRMPMLTNLRDLWVAVANERAGGWPDWQVQAESLVSLHATIVTDPHDPPR